MKLSAKHYRLILAIVLATLWTATAISLNSTHYYDSKAIERELAKILSPGPPVSLEPAIGGFPIAHMRYDFSQNNQLTYHEFSKDKLGLNFILCSSVVIAVATLPYREFRFSYLAIVFIGVLLSPLFVGYILFGPYPIVIAYAYFLPIVPPVKSTLIDRDQRGAERASG